MLCYNILDTDKTVDLGVPGPINGAPDDRHFSKSAMRALDVLDFFARSQRPAKAVEIAESLEIQSSSANQLLKTMAACGYLLFDVKRKTYTPSPRLLGIGEFVEKTYFGPRHLLQFMDHLREVSNCPVALTTPFGRHMRLVDFTLPEGRRYPREPGFLFPMFGSAAGSAIMANWPLGSVREAIAQSADQLAPTGLDVETILDRLRTIREDGHAFGGMSRLAEACSIAVALPLARFGTELAVSLRGTTSEMRAKRWQLAATIHDAIDQHLKYRPEL